MQQTYWHKQLKAGCTYQVPSSSHLIAGTTAHEVTQQGCTLDMFQVKPKFTQTQLHT